MSVLFRAARERWPRLPLASFAAAFVTTIGSLGLLGAATASATTSGPTAVPAPAAAWPLNDGSGTSAADSVGNNPATFDNSGDVSWAPNGQTSSTGLALSGTVGGCAHAAEPAVDTSQSFTVSAWVKFASTGGFQTITGINGTNISGLYLQLSAVTGTLAFTRRDSDSTGAGYALADSGVQPVAGTWYHVVGVDDTTTNTLKVYVDGIEGTDAAYSTPWQATGATSLGCGFWAGSPTDYVNGEVDDVQYFNSALTTAQVQNIDTAAQWTFGEGSGSTSADTTGNGHMLTLSSGASWARPGAVDPNALSFNGTPSSYASASSPVIDTSQSFSVGGWVRLNSTAGYQDLATVSGSNVSAFFLQLRADGKFAFTRLGSDSISAPTFAAESQANAQEGVWYYLTGVYDQAANSISLYVNGQLQSSTALPSGDAWRGAGDFYVGQGLYNGGAVDFLNGEVDDVSAYQYPLTASEVANITAGAGVNLNIDAGTQLHALPSTFFGLMTEDINHSMTGGLYAELINNRSMMASTNSPVDWNAVGDAQIALDPTNPLNGALTQSLKVNIVDANRRNPAGVSNLGYWGIPVRPDYTYRATVFAKATPGFSGSVQLAIQSSDGSQTYAHASIGPVGTDWKKYTVTLHTTSSAPVTADARYAVLTGDRANNGQTLWLDYVSLFPPTYDHLRNGLRVDLMQKFAQLDPSFIRLPGGNYLEGNTIATRFNWENTIGLPWQRPGHQDDAWGYWSTDGMGILEYAEWAQELGAQPLLAVYAGYSLDGAVVPQDQLQPYVNSAVDEIHYLTDPVTTSWGAMRAQDGHPAPFTINYVEVGNEDFFDRSGSYSSYRWPMFYNAIHAAFPDIKLIATTSVSSSDPQPYAIDDHYYQSPGWFDANAGLFNSTPRTGPKVFVGEWASQEGSPTPDLNAAIGDASWLTGLIRNSDVVMGESYAPGLVNVNNVAWATNLIGFDALTSFVSPSYWVQEMLAQNHGEEVIGSSSTGYQGMNTVTTENPTTHELYVTLVNPAQSSENVNVTLSGLPQVSSIGRAIVLTGTSGNEVNTISDPNQLTPQTSLVTGLAPQFTWTVPGHSVTILDLNVPAVTASTAQKLRSVYRCSRVRRKGHRKVLCRRIKLRSSTPSKHGRPRLCIRRTRAAARSCASTMSHRRRKPAARS